MIEESLSNKILTIGPAAKPQGGIAQVIINYMTLIFETMPRIEFNAGQKGAIIKNIVAFFLSLLKEFWILLTNRCIKIVHFHTAAGITFIRVSIGWLIAKAFKKKTIIHIHTGYFPGFYRKHQHYVRFVLNHSDRVVVLSKEWESFYTQEVGLTNIRVINNVIPSPILTEKYNDGLIHLLFLGHMLPKKGIFDLLQVMAQNREYFHGKLLLHIGGSRNEDQICDFITNNYIEDIVKFEGWVTGAEKIRLLNQCDIFILPSYVEGLPISILESMSYSMPIISTTIGGIPSVVSSNINGYLLKPGNLEALASAIQNYLDDPSLISMHGKESFKRVQIYLPPIVSDQLKALYDELL